MTVVEEGDDGEGADIRTRALVARVVDVVVGEPLEEVLRALGFTATIVLCELARDGVDAYPLFRERLERALRVH